MPDPLADVIRKANHGSSWTYDIAAAIRDHIAAVLDAEEAKWDYPEAKHFAAFLIDNLRATLLSTEAVTDLCGGCEHGCSDCEER